jgi:hypothetical protein
MSDNLNNTELNFREKLFELLDKFPKVRSPILTLYKKTAKNGNPYKTDHKKTSVLIKDLEDFIQNYKNSGILDFQSKQTYKRAQLELKRANHRLNLHNMYVQKYGVQQPKRGFQTAFEYSSCIGNLEIYEKQILLYCLVSTGFQSVLDYDFMTSLIDDDDDDVSDFERPDEIDDEFIFIW